MTSLSIAEVRKMKREGWRFLDSPTRVGNGWLFWAIDPRGNYDFQLVADPDDEPEKWSNDSGSREKGAQLSLL